MDYQEELQKIHNATELGNISALEDVKNTIESDRVNGENMGNAMVLMAAEQALGKLSQKQQEIGTIPEWRNDQIKRTDGDPEELQKRVWEVNERLDKAGTQGRINILSAIPDSLRSPAQRAELIELKQKIGEIAVASELDISKLNTGESLLKQHDQSMETYQDYMSSQIASGGSLWDLPLDDEPVSFTQPIQPTQEKVDESHKEYLQHEIDKIGSAISAGFGNEQALDRGIELEKKLDVYNQQPIPTEQNTINTLTEVPNQIINTELETKQIKSDFENTITSLTRDDLGSLYGILQNQGPIDGQSPDQVFAAIKIFMRGASDDSHIPESFGLRSKMNEIKKIRDAELAHHGIVIDKESGGATILKNNSQPENIPQQEIAPQSPEMNDKEKSSLVLERIKNAQSIDEIEDALRSVHVLHEGNTSIEVNTLLYNVNQYLSGTVDKYEIPAIGWLRERIVELKERLHNESIKPVEATQEVSIDSSLENKTTEPNSSLELNSNDELEPVIEDSEPIIPTILQKQTPENLFENMNSQESIKDKLFEQTLFEKLKVFTNGEFIKDFGENATLDENGYIIKGDGTKTNILPSSVDYVGALNRTLGISPLELQRRVKNEILTKELDEKSLYKEFLKEFNDINSEPTVDQKIKIQSLVDWLRKKDSQFEIYYKASHRVNKDNFLANRDALGGYGYDKGFLNSDQWRP